ncbi:hypothetical protein PVW46_09940 [Mameliella sp. AT18]|uniref:hypothetical protein n=1 Tax=Mameliella sp. AT18 TaxID=3028385 RepID=UPI00237BBD48|nr:hypothetical protein [Mameliella sp. AT18]MDD9730229.1 hypothetical protein [Mameliella sp. AT18]
MSLYLTNTGRITTDAGAIIASNSGLDDLRLINSGEMIGNDLYTVAEFSVYLANSGLIQTSGIQAGSGSGTTVLNSGTITVHGTGPALETGGAADVVRNTGTIFGDVVLAAGEDLFRNAGPGSVVGTVQGGGRTTTPLSVPTPRTVSRVTKTPTFWWDRVGTTRCTVESFRTCC